MRRRPDVDALDVNTFDDNSCSARAKPQNPGSTFRSKPCLKSYSGSLTLLKWWFPITRRPHRYVLRRARGSSQRAWTHWWCERRRQSPPTAPSALRGIVREKGIVHILQPLALAHGLHRRRIPCPHHPSGQRLPRSAAPVPAPAPQTGLAPCQMPPPVQRHRHQQLLLGDQPATDQRHPTGQRRHHVQTVAIPGPAPAPGCWRETKLARIQS